jgi:uncharacterized protein (UPF0297 family)
MSARKKVRKYQAIQNLEDGIKAYLFMNAILENYEDNEHEHVPIAKFVAKATLNELIQTYLEHNGNEALQKFADEINSKNGAGYEEPVPPIPSV